MEDFRLLKTVKMCQCYNLCTTFNQSKKFFSFLLSIDMHQSYTLVECHTTEIIAIGDEF